MQLKISTLNLCLGLKYKKVYVEQLLLNNNVNILCLQEVEIDSNYDVDLLKLPGFKFGIRHELNQTKIGNLYVWRYQLQQTLEGIDSHLFVIDTEGKSDIDFFKEFIVNFIDAEHL